MQKGKIKVYIFELLLIALFLFTLFKSTTINKILLAFILCIYTFISYKTFKKRNVVSIYQKESTIVLLVFAILGLGLLYFIGIFYGFYHATIKLSFWSIINYIIPLSAIVISSEIIRYVFISQEGKLTRLLCFIAMVLIDISLYLPIYDLSDLNEFLTALGLVIFSSLSCNLLFNYITNRFGYKGIVVYRLITTLYIYLIPITPDIYIFFHSIMRMVYPYIIYLVFEVLFGKRIKTIPKSSRNASIGFYTAITILIASISMLISCQFKYGIIVIGSGSMTGSINKGDATIFQKYNSQEIKKGDIVIFKRKNTKIIHRVVKIKVVNGKKRYYTKGDANQLMDDGYITDKSIIGISKLRIAYVGYPTIWIKELFSK